LNAVSVTRVAYAVDGWGEGELWFEGATLVWHELPQPTPVERASTSPHPHPGGETSRRPSRSTIPTRSVRDREKSVPEVARLVRNLQRYFQGDRPAFDAVALGTDGWTPFQRAVVAALRAVPWGEVVSYGELARNAGYPNAHRAAGTFCAQNRFPIIVPCHRVVSTAGIGGYGSLGVGYKRRLLELEGVTL
jgi:methylated-DNA-[protein]-cysteine S-methyltransferase